MYRWSKDKIKNFLKRFFLIDDTPHKIAAGAALGVFFGIAPGEGVATTLIVSTLLRFNRLAAAAGVIATNMWATFVVLPAAVFVGAFLTGNNYESLMSSFNSNRHLGWKFFIGKVFFFNCTLPIILGFFIVAGPIALLVYTGLVLLIVRYRKHKKSEHLFQKRLEG